ncbi:MAG: hypothetical protein ACREON_04950 [Gemmatimonadaceae bacterium]
MGLRFIFAYLVLYNLPFPLRTPFSGPLSYLTGMPDPFRGVVSFYTGLWYAIVPWVGEHILRLGTPITTFALGGDTTYNYVQVLCYVVIAIVTTAIWSVVDRRRENYVTLHHYLRIYIRYALGFAMLTYGMVKVIKAQFPFPSLVTLVESYGESSPMHLLWTMMGYSAPYNVFTGLVEAIGGVLLFWRRTTALGVLMVIGAMGNVVMLNLSYDVPVKLASIHLLLMGIFLAAPQGGRLLDVFVRHQTVGPEPIAAHDPRRGRRAMRLAVKSVAVLAGIGGPSVMALRLQALYGEQRVRPPLYGLYEVKEVVRNDTVVPPLITDSTRWRYVIIDAPGSLVVRSMTDSTHEYAARVDTVGRRVTLTPRISSTTSFHFRYAPSAPERLHLSGSMGGDSLELVLHRQDPREFLLVSRGFRWISERALNR